MGWPCAIAQSRVRLSENSRARSYDSTFWSVRPSGPVQRPFSGMLSVRKRGDLATGVFAPKWFINATIFCLRIASGKWRFGDRGGAAGWEGSSSFGGPGYGLDPSSRFTRNDGHLQPRFGSGKVAVWRREADVPRRAVATTKILYPKHLARRGFGEGDGSLIGPQARPPFVALNFGKVAIWRRAG